MVKKVIKTIWSYNHRAIESDHKDYDILMDNKIRIKVFDYFKRDNLDECLKAKYDYLAVVFSVEDIVKVKWLKRKDVEWITKDEWQKTPYFKGFFKRKLPTVGDC